MHVQISLHTMPLHPLVKVVETGRLSRRNWNNSRMLETSKLFEVLSIHEMEAILGEFNSYMMQTDPVNKKMICSHYVIALAMSQSCVIVAAPLLVIQLHSREPVSSLNHAINSLHSMQQIRQMVIISQVVTKNRPFMSRMLAMSVGKMVQLWIAPRSLRNTHYRSMEMQLHVSNIMHLRMK